MKIIVDTTILVRAVVQDDIKQARAAIRLLQKAQLIVVSLPTLCELVWVLRRVYGFTPSVISNTLDALLNAANVVTNRPAVEAGLAMLKEGGDFADGLIAWEGRWLGGEVFVSFEKKAVQLLTGRGEAAELLV